MNILLDFLPFQAAGGIGGAASFTKVISDEVIRLKPLSTKLFATYDSTMPVGKQYNYKKYAEQNAIVLLDISSSTIAQYIAEQDIDVFFIAIGQFYARYSLDGINCKTLMFIHDIWDVESCDNLIDLTIHDKLAESSLQWAKRMLNIVFGRYKKRKQRIYQHIMPLYSAPQTIAYTVSEYTKFSLKYYFPELHSHEIRICYSPAKCTTILPQIENRALSQLITDNKQYLLMLAANRIQKNPHTLLKVFKRLLVDYPNLHLLTLKYGHSVHPQHIDIPFLIDSDLEYAYKHAHALVFASYFEGFGYPPIEALRHGTPTVASNVTSIPEILGKAGIYFSPFYPADLYRAIINILQKRNHYKNIISQRYEEITQRQQNDLNKLVNEILNENKI